MSEPSDKSKSSRARKATDASVMRSLGAFFGNVWSGVRSDPKRPVPKRLQSDEERVPRPTDGGPGGGRPRVVRVEEEHREAEGEVEGRRVVLREKVVREIEFVNDDETPRAGP